MIKKLFTLAASALMVSGAWGETKISKGITFSYDENAGTVIYAGSASTPSVTETYNYDQYTLTLTITTSKNINNHETEYICTPVSINSTTTSVDLTITGATTNITDSSSNTNYSGDLYDDEGNLTDKSDFLAAWNIIKNKNDNAMTGTEVLAEDSSAKDDDGDNIENDCYYFKEIKTEKNKKNQIVTKTYYHYVTSAIVIEESINNYIDKTKSFIVNILPAGILNNSTVSLTIPSSITTIADNAFANVSSSLTTINATGNFTMDGAFLMDAAKTTIYYVLPSANGKTYNLDNTITTIKPYALKNCSGVTLISNNNLTVGDNQGSNTIQCPENLTVSDGKITGVVNNTNFYAWITGANKPSEGSIVDLTEATFVENITTAFTVPNNCILYFPTTRSNGQILTVNGDKNIVIGTTCANYVLTDGITSYSIPKGFTATAASYNRSIGNNWSTIVLPFTVPAAQVKNMGCIIATYSSHDTNTNTFSFTKLDNGTIEANVPCLIKRTSGSGTFNFNSINVSATSAGTKGQGNFVGVYEQYVTPTISAGSITADTDLYYGFSGGYFRLFSGVTINPFRGYFMGKGSSYNANSPENRFDVVFEDEEGFEIDENITCIDMISNNDTNNSAIYNIYGQKVDNASNGIFIKNGKTIIIK